MALKHKNLYYVGGVVRDEILGVQSFDTDLCYVGNAIEYAQNEGLNIIKINPDFGTVRVICEGKETDIASTREESYPNPGQLPVVSNIGCPLEVDLRRRDFSVNAIAKNTLTGEIFDPIGGMDDIKTKKLKVLHDKSFIDDPTRIIRGLKFAVRFGFNLDDLTLKLQSEYLYNINYDMSYHRVKKELVETFNLNIAAAFDKFVEYKIYKLLSKDSYDSAINGHKIKELIDRYEIIESWLVYASFFNLSSLPLTRREKQILEWADRLKEQEKNNNTPIESVVISELRRSL